MLHHDLSKGWIREFWDQHLCNMQWPHKGNKAFRKRSAIIEIEYWMVS